VPQAVRVSALSDATLLLVGHGSSFDKSANASVYTHAAELRGRKLFAQVREAFLKEGPGVVQALSATTSPRVFVVPLFISEGYYTEQMIPRSLGLTNAGQSPFSGPHLRGCQQIYYCRPVGTHQAMAQVILSRAEEVVARYPFPRPPQLRQTALFVAGHGTDRHEDSRKAIERQVEAIRGRQIYAEVHGVFLEEEPGIGDCYRLASAPNLVVVPFFISDGPHVQEDIPLALGEPESVVRRRRQLGQATWRNPSERNGRRVWLAASVGSAPCLAEVILERVSEACHGALANHPTI
jgi:sirohydrochlorin cobaltochelatase